MTLCRAIPLMEATTADDPRVLFSSACFLSGATTYTHTHIHIHIYIYRWWKKDRLVRAVMDQRGISWAAAVAAAAAFFCSRLRLCLWLLEGSCSRSSVKGQVAIFNSMSISRGTWTSRCRVYDIRQSDAAQRCRSSFCARNHSVFSTGNEILIAPQVRVSCLRLSPTGTEPMCGPKWHKKQ